MVWWILPHQLVWWIWPPQLVWWIWPHQLVWWIWPHQLVWWIWPHQLVWWIWPHHAVGAVNLSLPVGAVDLASLVGVVNLASPVGVVNLASTSWCGESGSTSWCSKSVPTSWCSKSVPTSWCGRSGLTGFSSHHPLSRRSSTRDTSWALRPSCRLESEKDEDDDSAFCLLVITNSFITYWDRRQTASSGKRMVRRKPCAQWQVQRQTYWSATLKKKEKCILIPHMITFDICDFHTGRAASDVLTLSSQCWCAGVVCFLEKKRCHPPQHHAARKLVTKQLSTTSEKETEFLLSSGWTSDQMQGLPLCTELQRNQSYKRKDSKLRQLLLCMFDPNTRNGRGGWGQVIVERKNVWHFQNHNCRSWIFGSFRITALGESLKSELMVCDLLKYQKFQFILGAPGPKVRSREERIANCHNFWCACLNQHKARSSRVRSGYGGEENAWHFLINIVEVE